MGLRSEEFKNKFLRSKEFLTSWYDKEKQVVDAFEFELYDDDNKLTDKHSSGDKYDEFGFLIGRVRSLKAIEKQAKGMAKIGFYRDEEIIGGIV